MALKLLANIREPDCIGCTKCIDVCPVDAILGSFNQMHTVLNEECIGCKLCLPACPVDCIDLIPLPSSQPRIAAEHVKQRYQARQKRLSEQSEDMMTIDSGLLKKKQYVEDALARVRERKSTFK